MKPYSLLSPIAALLLMLSTPLPVFAHVGHGDEFQATGGINRVQVNPETDQQLGITVTPIEQAAAGGAGVMIPVTAIVDADGKQLVFVQYENFYEPVEIATGTSQGDLIEVTQGLSVGEKLVTQGSLMLYAQSRKTQPTDAAANPEAAANQAATASPQPANHAQADAQGVPHSHDATGNMVQPSSNVAQEQSRFPMGTVGAIGGGALLLLGFVTFVTGNRKKKSAFSNRKGGF